MRPARFDGRAEAYDRARPGYPAEAVARACDAARLGREHVVADVGAGTGKLTEVLAARFDRVIAVEPSASMREVLARVRCEIIAGTAELSGLPDSSLDAIFAAQAFHWFDPEATCRAWSRVLRGPRAAILMWNDRLDDTPAGAAVSALLEAHQTEARASLGHFGAARDARLARFAAAGARLGGTARHRHELVLDEDALVAWSASISYLPRPGAPGHREMTDSLRSLFAQHQEHGVVKLRFELVTFSYEVA